MREDHAHFDFPSFLLPATQAIDVTSPKFLFQEYRSRLVTSFVLCALGVKSGQLQQLTNVILHQTHYETSDWSTAFNQFTRAP